MINRTSEANAGALRRDRLRQAVRYAPLPGPWLRTGLLPLSRPYVSTAKPGPPTFLIFCNRPLAHRYGGRGARHAGNARDGPDTCVASLTGATPGAQERKDWPVPSAGRRQRHAEDSRYTQTVPFPCELT